MTKNSSIAVIIPTHNSASYVTECVDSVLNQRCLPKEIIVVDDCSSDATVEILQRYSDDVRLLLNSQNLGPGQSRNRGVVAASADCLAFLDSDDVWEPNHLQVLMSLLEETPRAGVAYSRASLFGSEEGIWPHVLPVEDGVSANVFMPLMRNNFILPSGMMLRREHFERVKGFDDIVRFYKRKRVQAEDYDLFLRLSLETEFVGTSEPTLRYRCHSGQSSISKVPQILMAFTYRLRVIHSLANTDNRRHLAKEAEERMLLCWEEHIENTWAARETKSLRMMVAYGLRAPRLREATKRYALRAMTPHMVATVMQHST